MTEHIDLKKIFASNVFTDSEMRNRLEHDTYIKMKQTIDKGEPLSIEVADKVAQAMMEWAIEKGATHYTHWFQPLNGVTAEKHECFLSPTRDGQVEMEFSGKMLIKGESDASSFPSGGLRATFEARGYTAWDCTSPAFLKEDVAGVTLCIPTAFCSYNGEALDEKTPLLRSMEAIQKQALRLLHLLGDNTTTAVTTSVGAEQEYFLIDKSLFKRRLDLVLCGRTLFGAKPPKSQELEDHYYGSIKERVASFMKELDVELWKMGVSAKTKHNEAAPAQHELAPVYNTTNIAADQNQLIMETMKKIADRKGLACLLHEKPFSYINGSGKHNNWSLTNCDTGKSLLSPGKKPEENMQFLLFLTAIIAAVDSHSDLIRATTASASNDHRLGAYEAPPAVISIFLGSQLSGIVECYCNGLDVTPTCKRRMSVGSTAVPSFDADNTDRNRTSPFAFTGNKFEFRMLGSSQPLADTNAIINTIVAEQLDEICNYLEGADDLNQAIKSILSEKLKKHSRIIFDGNGYSEEWKAEANRRGLPNISNTVDAMDALINSKAINLFSKFNVLSESELHARYEILLEAYIKQVSIEAKIMIDMAENEIIPACCEYSGKVANSINNISNVGYFPSTQNILLQKLLELIEKADKTEKELQEIIIKSANLTGTYKEKAVFVRDVMLLKMQELRSVCDELEIHVRKRYWPFPTYAELLFEV